MRLNENFLLVLSISPGASKGKFRQMKIEYFANISEHFLSINQNALPMFNTVLAVKLEQIIMESIC